MSRRLAPRPKPKRGGASPRRKGDTAERALVKYLLAHGFNASRVPLSGSAGGKYKGDLNITLLGVDRCAEVKIRADGFRALYAWLVDRDLLIIRSDRHAPLIVLPLALAVEIARVAEQMKRDPGGA